jgi:DNA mismatch endonuclease (patch repair protein)
MADDLTREERSERMRRVRSKNTKPEMTVRRLLYSLGYRYRVHPPDIPGKPDIAFKGRRKLIFVHGCFWHRHEDPACKLARLPKSRLDFWLPKLNANRERDKRLRNRLFKEGWRILVVWECELRDKEQLRNKLVRFLEGEDEIR